MPCERKTFGRKSRFARPDRQKEPYKLAGDSTVFTEMPRMHAICVATLVFVCLFVAICSDLIPWLLSPADSPEPEQVPNRSSRTMTGNVTQRAIAEHDNDAIMRAHIRGSTSIFVGSFDALNNLTHGRSRRHRLRQSRRQHQTRGTGSGGNARKKRHIETAQIAAPSSVESQSAPIMKLKAVRTFLDDLSKFQSATTDLPMQGHAEPSLVQTRKYSGRIQTGCIGGCFRA